MATFHNKLMDIDRSALVVVDLQEAFRGVIDEYDRVIQRSAMAVSGFRSLGRPILVTEQYPKGLGQTVSEIGVLLTDREVPFEKTAFSSCGAEAFVESLRSSDIQHVAICGIEAHICVNQTVHDLLAYGFAVHLLTDAISSRRASDRSVGIEKMIGSGAVGSSVEMALFEMLRDARHEQFKTIQGLVK